LTNPGPRARYRIPRSVIEDTRDLLRPSTDAGVEGVVVWWGRVVDEAAVDVIAAYRPHQVAYRSPLGLSVAVPPEAISQMISDLPPGVFVAARLHTHAEHAYHSPMDDLNMLVAHDGALSIVVPHLARDAIDLEHCSVNMLRRGRGWRELSRREVRRRLEVIDE
jgi:hypothetical protein